MMWCEPFIFSGFTSIHQKIVTVITYHLIYNALQMSKTQFDFEVANGVANDILPVRWMEVYPFRFNQ